MTTELKSPAYMRLLPPALIGRIGRMELLARGLMQGFVTGKHRSPHKGFSVEFAEHRQYVMGDDLRDLDWRVFGKTDRYYIRQYVEETNLRATILVDASGSMRYAGKAAAPIDGRPTVSKFEYARHVAAALSYLLINQQDAVGLVTFDTAVRRYFPARARPTQVRLILQELTGTEPGGETDLGGVLHAIAERIPRRGLVIVISDLLGDVEQIVKALHHFHFNRHELIVLHVLADEELTFPFRRFTHFHDLEPTGALLPIDPHTVRARYLDRVREFLGRIEDACGELKADYVPMCTREPFDATLTDYLSHRKRK
jgi:uncharacterized protein (DUF58 family)